MYFMHSPSIMALYFKRHSCPIEKSYQSVQTTDVYFKYTLTCIWTEQKRDYVMKIFSLFYAFLIRFQVTLGQDDSDSSGGSDGPKKIGVGGGTSAAPFSECFTTKCDANSFEMIIEVVKACPQFEAYKGFWLNPF